MPSFRFRGFASASNVALSVAQGARSEGADLIWAQAPAPSTASFTIARIDPIADEDLVGPVGLAFAPVNITGFVGFDGQPISAPTDPEVNAYDPTALEIFWSWSFGEPDYVPLVTPNVPTAHRDTNRAFVQRPVHVFSPGAKTVTLYGYDSAGNWATATYTFANTPGANAPEIADPDDYFTGDDTIFFSVDGIFPANPPAGALLTSSLSAANTRIQQRSTLGRRFARLRFRRGEVYTDLGSIGGGDNTKEADGSFRHDRTVYVDAYDDPTGLSTAEPVHRSVNSGPAFQILGRCPRYVDQDFQGPWDAATETGRRHKAIHSQSYTGSRYVLYHRLKVSGFDMFETRRQRSVDDAWRIFSDIDITDWMNYGIFGSGDWHAIIGCDIHLPENALSGINQGGSSSNPFDMGNRHGPIRHSANRLGYVACSSFFTRSGWSQIGGSGSGEGWITRSATAHQLAYRLQKENRTYLNHHAFDRCSFEGGGGVALAEVSPTVGPQGAGGANLLFESCLVVAGRESRLLELRLGGMGGAVRNCYFYVPSAPYNAGVVFDEFVTGENDGTPSPGLVSRYFIHNNTILMLGTDAQVGVGTRVVASIGAHHNPVVENNILYGPNLSTVLGAQFAPLGTSPLAGFTTRYRGARFNFPPIGHPQGWIAPGSVQANVSGLSGLYTTCEGMREINDGIGRVTPVAPGEWMSVPYPDYTGFCNGALGQVTQAMVLANSGQYHQLSVSSSSGIKSLSWAEGGDSRDRVRFEFTPTAIRILNNSTETWTGPFWLLLDLRDYLMDFVPGTASPASIPAPVPSGDSAAIVPADLGLRARTDFLGALRPTPATLGALEAAV